MKRAILHTNNSWTLPMLRIFLGLVILAHGAQKLLGWFDGYGFSGTMKFFTETVGLPWIVGLLVIILEFFGSLALIAGLGTRLVAFSFIPLALGIMITSHIQNGFFMNWGGTQQGEGIEYFILWIAITIPLVVHGAGKLSVDKWLVEKSKQQQPIHDKTTWTELLHQSEKKKRLPAA